jgi:dihydroorotase
MLKLVDQKVISLLDAISRVTIQPARILGIDVGQLTPGAPADICIFDPGTTWQVDATGLQSRGNNTPFDGTLLSGVVDTVLIAGRIRLGRTLPA